ncbi:cation transporter [Rhizobium sp. BR 314]|uniref:cation transporter n=1 Tax=Rhizobium sp. BR 314 TaxID=3040013 RepID=UPI0039BF54F6
MRTALRSFFVSPAVLAVKYTACRMTVSVALLCDALESIINVASALAVIVSVKIVSHPPGDYHPSGHNKGEYRSAVLVDALIVTAALAIIHDA